MAVSRLFRERSALFNCSEERSACRGEGELIEIDDLDKTVRIDNDICQQIRDDQGIGILMIFRGNDVAVMIEKAAVRGIEAADFVAFVQIISKRSRDADPAFFSGLSSRSREGRPVTEELRHPLAGCIPPESDVCGTE